MKKIIAFPPIVVAFCLIITPNLVANAQPAVSMKTADTMTVQTELIIIMPVHHPIETATARLETAYMPSLFALSVLESSLS